MGRKLKIAVIGAGSPLFTPDLMASLLEKSELYGSAIHLFDIDGERLEFMRLYSSWLMRANGNAYEVAACACRDEALSAADIVISTVAVGGVAMQKHDVEVPLKYGITHIKGDTTGPAGIFRGLRTIPFILDLAASMERLCPKARLINLTNPMTVVTRAANAGSSVKAIGICSAIDGMRADIAGKLGLDAGELALYSFGVNHFTWMSGIARCGRDIMDEFTAKALPVYISDLPVTGDLVKTFGCFPIPGFKYASEFFRWYLGPETHQGRDFGFSPCDPGRKAEDAARIYGRLKQRMGGDGYVPDALNTDTQIIAGVIESIALNRPAVWNLNVPNAGQLPGLPLGAVVEGPVYVSGETMLPLCCPGLPESVMKLLERVAAEQELVAKAGMQGDRRLLLDALLLDPLVNSPVHARNIVDELLVLERAYLPQFYK